MSGASERLVTRDELLAEVSATADLGEHTGTPVEVLTAVLDGIEAAGYAVVPEAWVPDAASLDTVHGRLMARAHLTQASDPHAAALRQADEEISRMTDFACAWLGLPPRGERS